MSGNGLINTTGGGGSISNSSGSNSSSGGVGVGPAPADLTLMKEEELRNGDGVLDVLQRRFDRGEYHTLVGESLLILNAFTVNSDTPASQQQQQQPQSIQGLLKIAKLARLDAPPVPGYIAERALRDALRSKQGSCIVFRGDSGSGKSFAASAIGKYIVTRCASPKADYRRKLDLVEVVATAFCHARTPSNRNASKYARFGDFSINPATGLLNGFTTHMYLLDVWRVADSNAMREHNFHVFYYVNAGLANNLPGRSVSQVANFRYLLQDNNTRGIVPELQQKFQELREALATLSIPPEEQRDVFATVSAILHLGELSFVSVEPGHVGEGSQLARIRTEGVNASLIANLLKIPRSQLEDVLLNRDSSARNTGPSRQTILPMTIAQCMHARDAIAKGLYERLVAWIFHRINACTAPRPTAAAAKDASTPVSLGMLDMFGFVKQESNGFQHLSVNMANETLHHMYLESVFATEVNDLLALQRSPDHISLDLVSFRANEECVLLCMARPGGILSVIETLATDESSTVTTLMPYLDRLVTNSRYRKVEGKNEFKISHFRNRITYDATTLLPMNRDYSLERFINTLKDSESILIQQLGRISISHSGSLKMNTRTQEPSASLNGIARYRASLRQLMHRISGMSQHFVTCMGSNKVHAPKQFDRQYVASQVKAYSVIEAAWAKKFGYPLRYTHEQFLARFSILGPTILPTQRETSSELCSEIVRLLNLRTAEVVDNLILLKLEDHDKADTALLKYNRMAAVIQRAFRARRFAASLAKNSSRGASQSNGSRSPVAVPVAGGRGGLFAAAAAASSSGAGATSVSLRGRLNSTSTLPANRSNLSTAAVTKSQRTTAAAANTGGRQLASGIIDGDDPEEGLYSTSKGVMEANHEYEDMDSDVPNDDDDDDNDDSDSDIDEQEILTGVPSKPPRDKPANHANLASLNKRTITALIAGLDRPVVKRPPLPPKPKVLDASGASTAPPLPPRNPAMVGEDDPDFSPSSSGSDSGNGTVGPSAGGSVAYAISGAAQPVSGAVTGAVTERRGSAPTLAPRARTATTGSAGSGQISPRVGSPVHVQPQQTRPAVDIGTLSAGEQSPAGLRGYYPRLSREQVDEMLANTENGTYIIRESSRGGWSISVQCSGRIRNFQVSVQSGVLYMNGWDAPFTNFAKLIEQLHTTPFTLEHDVLVAPFVARTSTSNSPGPLSPSTSSGGASAFAFGSDATGMRNNPAPARGRPPATPLGAQATTPLPPRQPAPSAMPATPAMPSSIPAPLHMRGSFGSNNAPLGPGMETYHRAETPSPHTPSAAPPGLLPPRSQSMSHANQRQQAAPQHYR